MALTILFHSRDGSSLFIVNHSHRNIKTKKLSIILIFDVWREKKKPSAPQNGNWRFIAGPSGESRTHGLLNPIQARYQTALHPDFCNIVILAQPFQNVKRFFGVPEKNLPLPRFSHFFPVFIPNSET